MPSPYSSSRHAGRRARAGRGARGRARTSCRSRRSWTPTSRRSRAEFDGRAPDLTEENLQARIRGNLLMALSNKFGWLVLTTGNKSEMSVGYTTLYGDLAGGFAVIKDVPKTLVYRLCEWRNSPAAARRASAASPAPIPASIIERAALRRAAPRPARRGLAAAVRGARPHPAGLRRARPQPRAADRPGPARRGGRARDPPRRPRRVQAPPGAPGHQGHRRARSGATGACRSPTATAAEP